MDITNSAIDEDDDEISGTSDLKTTAMLKIYEEICKSYHANDNFRTKLLGFLPLTSLIGIFSLSSNNLFTSPNSIMPWQHLVTFVGVFAAAFTLALFIYEIRGILRCHDLILKGRDIEHELKIKGQFIACVEEHKCNENDWKKQVVSFLNSKLAACLIYSTVFAAWIFMVARFGFDMHIYGCVFTAVFAGLVVGVGTHFLVESLIAT